MREGHISKKMRLVGPVLLLLATPIAAEQIRLGSAPSSSPPPSSKLSTSLIDLLSVSPQHTLLLNAIQRAQLVPLINKLNGSTFFAPTDAAIRAAQQEEATASPTGVDGAPDADAVWSWGAAPADSSPPRDNLHLALRETILYHVLNYTLPEVVPGGVAAALVKDDKPSLHETLYIPSLSPYNRTFPAPPSLPGSPPEDPDPDHPSKRGGLLSNEGQKLRTLRKGSSSLLVGVDWKGAGGVRTTSNGTQVADNGVLVAVDGVLKKPKDLSYLIKTRPELSTTASLLTKAILDYISTAAHMTIFAPTNEAWVGLSSLEMSYLRSGFADGDLIEIFGDMASAKGAGKGTVGYLDYLIGEDGKKEAQVETIYNSTLKVSATAEGTVFVNETAITTGDILASNGVLHTQPSMLLPSGSLSLTAEKYLIALNATRFVTLLRSVNLSDYVQIPSGDPTFAGDDQPAFTILAPRDDVFDTVSDWGWHTEKGGFPAPGSEALKDVLKYHIIAGKWMPEQLQDGLLLGTELQPASLGGERQRMPVTVTKSETSHFSGRGGHEIELIGFKDANVIRDALPVGNSVIYVLGAVLQPPVPMVATAVSDIRLSTFVASVYAAGLEKTLDDSPAITYLAPENDAYTNLGLVMPYLLNPSARAELRSLIRYHAIAELDYIEDFPDRGSRKYPTLDDSEIYVEYSEENSTFAVHGPTVGGMAANGEVRPARIIEGDILTSSGVIHVVDQVELPPTLNIGIAKLLRGAKASTMARLINAANMTWLLEGKPPPEDYEELDGSLVYASKHGLGLKGKKKKKKLPQERVKYSSDQRVYTLLCPTDKALARVNISYYLNTPEALSALVRLHVIPTDAFATLQDDGRPLSLSDEVSYPSLLDVHAGGPSDYGQVAFRQWGVGGWLVGVKGARGTQGATDWARIVTWGRSTPRIIKPADGGTEPRQLTVGGGVLMIDSVLEPYYPSWFMRWGWIVVVVVLCTGLGACICLLGWKAWKSKQDAGYSVVEEGQEEP